jgi:PAS domain S-box-containing protein
MTEAERDAFVEDKLACEHEKHMARQEKLLDATRKVLAQKDLNSLLQTAADAARELTGAKYAVTGHGYVNGVFTAGGVSRSEGAMPCPPGEAFNVEKGGVYLDLIQEKNSIRLTDAEMRSHPAWWDLPESHVPLRGLLGARLVDVNGQPNGLLMASDKEDGGDFTAEDETILSQLAAIVSLALQHIEARLETEREKRRLEALMKSLPVGVSFSDNPTCQCITGNPAVLAQFEVEPEDNLSASAPNGNAPGRQVRYFMDGRQITDAELPLQRAVAENREIPPVELEVELPSGRRWFTEAAGAPIIDSQGNAIGGVAVTVDITERKQAEVALQKANEEMAAVNEELAASNEELRATTEELRIEIKNREKAEKALRQSEQKFAAIFALTPLPVALIKVPEGTLVEVNEAWEKFFECPRQEAIGNTPNELGFVSDPENRDRLYADLKSRGSVRNWEMSYRTRSGKDRAGIFNYDRIEIGGQMYHLGTGTDITARRQAEEALRESEARFRSVLDNSMDLVYRLNLQTGRYEYMSPTSETVIGWSPDEIMAEDFATSLSRIHPDDLPRVRAALASLEDNGIGEVEYRRRTRSGDYRWLSNHMSLTKDSAGRPMYRDGSIRDITERKRAGEALLKAKDELEQRVQERTADLSKAKEELEIINEELQVEIEQHQKLEAELIKAKDQAVEAVQAKAAFLANMSHELRTPMNSIMGFTSLLLEEPLPVEYKDWLDTMKINGEALLALINDVLDFSKMEKDKIELEIHPFNLRQRIEESLDLVSTKAAEKGLDLAYIMDSNVPETIISDSARLRQVLANLLSNAVKFTDTGDVLVHITSKPEGDFHELHFAVQDTGIGMPQSQISKLFQPFSQINTAPSRLTEGTGLGLAISKKLVELMGGKIWAESEEGKGSTFIFTIKARAAPDDTATKLPAGPQPQLVKRNALIVDDNQTMRRLLGHQTKSWGMVPLVVSLSYSANELIQNGVTPDVAIIDASMPDLNGIVLAQMIRRYRRDLPLIIMTSPGQHIPQNLL